MAHSTIRQAIEKYVVRHKGKAIQVYQMPIPGYYGLIGDDVLELAAEKAYKNGWKKIVLTWEDMPCMVCFEEGYCMLVATNIATIIQDKGRHSFWYDKHILCEMSRDGNVYVEPPRKRDEEGYYID